MQSFKSMLPPNKTKHILAIVLLILSGEIIFSLPFYLTRYFRPTFLESMSLTNTEMGDIFAVYGITAALAYLPGGVIADRFNPKLLMGTSLILTGLGGVALLCNPTITDLKMLYGFWGITTILLFWCPLIKLTRLWGGAQSQGIAFGLLDGGRGIVAAICASIGVMILHVVNNKGFFIFGELNRSIDAIIACYVILTITSGFLILTFLTYPKLDGNSIEKRRSYTVLINKKLWLHAAIIVSSYSAYKCLDYYSLFMFEVYRWSEEASAGFSATVSFLRPLSAFAAGLLSDRIGSSSSLKYLFLILVITYIYLAFGSSLQDKANLIIANLTISACAVFALRAIYFALLEENQVPQPFTGSAVGLISMVGFLPDIFFSPIAGRILDSKPGINGYSELFLFMTVIIILGMFATIGITYLKGTKQETGGLKK